MPNLFRRAAISRRGFLTGTALVASGAALAACNTGASPSTSSSGGTVTLTVMYNNNELTKDHIADFEAQNPAIKVNFSSTTTPG